MSEPLDSATLEEIRGLLTELEGQVQDEFEPMKTTLSALASALLRSAGQEDRGDDAPSIHRVIWDLRRDTRFRTGQATATSSAAEALEDFLSWGYPDDGDADRTSMLDLLVSDFVEACTAWLPTP